MADITDPEVQAVMALLRRLHSAELHLVAVSAAWHHLNHESKCALEAAAPELVDALVRIPRQTIRQEDPT